MKLTGLAKEDFELYLKENYNQLIVRTGNDSTFLSDLLQAEHIKKTDTLLANVIIEFFDSAGIWNKVFLECCDNGLGNYKEAINASIEKANVIYNESKLLFM